MDKSQIKKLMKEAVIEGRKAIGKSGMNPPVGCVLVKQGRIISKGHTGEPGMPHAEAMALNRLEGELDKVIAFVTLEPCSFHGRTPSCAQALVKRGIREVYVGMIDPHPKNQGAGLEILRGAGAVVHLGILNQEVSDELSEHIERYR